MDRLGRPERRGRGGRRMPAASAMVFAFSLALVLVGCGTGGIAVKKDIWDAQEDFERRQTGLSEKVLGLEARVAAQDEEIATLGFKLDELSKQIAALDEDLSRGIEAVRDGQQQLGIELEGKIRNGETARKSDRDDLLARIDIVLSEVTNENQRLRREIDSVRTAVSSGSSHVVKPGETLASIAAQHGVTISGLIEANKIENPDIIPVGAKLIIPGR